LARVCGWHAILPSSTKISNYRRDTEDPLDGGGSSKVWVGTLNERKVIIKVPDVYQSYDDTKKRELIKVSYYVRPGQQRYVDVYALISYRTFARRW